MAANVALIRKLRDNQDRAEAQEEIRIRVNLMKDGLSKREACEKAKAIILGQRP